MTRPEQPLQLLWIKPPGFVYAESLRDAIESVRHGLRELGIEAPLTENVALANHLPIVFGAHLLGPNEEDQIPPHAVLYNLEQFAPGYAGASPRYHDLLARFRVWDASTRNVAYLRDWGINPAAQHVPLGYAPQLTRVAPAADEDVDVLFFGIASPRRQTVIDALRQRGLRVAALNGVFGTARDEQVARAKLVLNVRFGDAGGLEFPRLLYLLANGKAVVSEAADDAEATGLADGFLETAYGELADACVALCADAARRKALAQRGHERVRALGSSAAALDAALAALPAQPPAIDRDIVPPRLPHTLNLGSGRRFRPWCLNADIDPRWEPDCLLDVDKPLPAPAVVPTRRFGGVELRAGSFDAVVADHLLEHVADLPTTMGNALALLRDGGTLHAEVPYDLSYGAWQDPRHVRAFNERSWLYYTDWHWYLGWEDARFDLVDLRFGPSPYGRSLLADGIPLIDVLLRPRAIDVMRVELRKRPLRQS